MPKQNTFALCIVYVFLCVTTLSTFVMAQDSPTELVLDTPVTGELDGNGAAEWTYTISQPEVVTVWAHSLEEPGVIDTTLEFLGPDGYRLPGGFNDDRPDTTDSRIENLILPDAGTYTVRVNSFNGVSEGQVEVGIEAGDIFQEVIRDESGQITISAVLPAYGRYQYPVELTAEDTITVTVRDTSGTLDPIVTLYGPTGDSVAANDDHAAAPDWSLDIFDAQITGFTTAESGLYTIAVTDFIGVPGTFDLMIAPANMDAMTSADASK